MSRKAEIPKFFTHQYLSDANMHGAYTSMSMILSKEDEERRWKANLRAAQASIVSCTSIMIMRP